MTASTYVCNDLSQWYAAELRYEESLAPTLSASIRLSTDGLLFFGKSTESWEACKVGFIPFEGELLESLKSTFFAVPTLSLPFKSTRLYIEEEGSYIAVPHDLAVAGAPKEWLRTCTYYNSENDELLTVDEDDPPLSLHFKVRRELYEFCQRSFSLPRFDHLQRPLIAAAMRYSRRHHPRVMMCIVGRHTLDVACAEEGQLLLANRYSTTDDPVDTLYFVTALWRQMGLSAQVDHLYLYSAQHHAVDRMIPYLSTSIAHLYVDEYPGMVIDPVALESLSLTLPPAIILDTLCE